MDKLSLCTALEGIEAVFVITPDFLDEVTAMNNLVGAVNSTGEIKRIFRMIEDPPGLRNEEDVAQVLRDYEFGTATQHLKARKVLSESRLPGHWSNHRRSDS